ncbi:MAG: hypothetical protein UW24_C0012G0002 [Parcubacteria group bacterium GW2011_GWA2_44_12]|nr:MAG: hypothetical protein UW24_C0012G0002 [Parcubacteria group bacterium GW2011_GWA2_44_12]
MNIENYPIQREVENGVEGEKKRKRIVLVDLQYPYEKKKVYMSGALCSVGARLLAMGHEVNIVDFNIDNYTDQSVQDCFRGSDLIGITVIGSPLLPGAVELVRRVRQDHPHAVVMLGGQVIENISNDGFRAIFCDQANVHQITDDIVLLQLLNEETDYPIPGSLNIPYVPVWEQMGDDRLKTYMQTEMTLVVGQGCAYNCHFFSAPENNRAPFGYFGENTRRNKRGYQSALPFVPEIIFTCGEDHK